MQKLIELEDSVSRLSDTEYSKFRQRFLDYEIERWDAKIEKDITGRKLDSLSEQAIKDFKQGKYKFP